MGDFNARHSAFGDHSSLKRGADLNQLIQNFPVTQCKPENGHYTTITSTGGKGVTDLLFSSDPNMVDSFEVLENESLGGSDHRPLVWNMDSSHIHPSNVKRQRWNLQRFIKEPSTLVEYQQELIHRYPSNLFSTGLELLNHDKTAYLDSLRHSITAWITECLQNSCGYTSSFRNHRGMFWTNELLLDSQKLNELSNSVPDDPSSLRAHLEEKRTLFRRYAQNRAKRHLELNRSFLDEICKSGNKGQFYR